MRITCKQKLLREITNMMLGVLVFRYSPIINLELHFQFLATFVLYRMRRKVFFLPVSPQSSTFTS